MGSWEGKIICYTIRWVWRVGKNWEILQFTSTTFTRDNSSWLSWALNYWRVACWELSRNCWHNSKSTATLKIRKGSVSMKILPFSLLIKLIVSYLQLIFFGSSIQSVIITTYIDIIICLWIIIPICQIIIVGWSLRWCR